MTVPTYPTPVPTASGTLTCDELPPPPVPSPLPIPTCPTDSSAYPQPPVTTITSLNTLPSCSVRVQANCLGTPPPSQGIGPAYSTSNYVPVMPTTHPAVVASTQTVTPKGTSLASTGGDYDVLTGLAVCLIVVGAAGITWARKTARGEHR